ncbi:MAG: cytochrome P450, partial [Novosphingobium sp.]|nr:cytochrome P450 [Novosphingobium sp.]
MAMEDPVSLLKELRDQTPVGHSKKHGGYYVVTRYEDCVVAARDARLSSDPRDGPGPGFPFSADVPLRQPMIMDEGARHSQFRMPLQRMFSPNYAKSLREKIHHICDKLIDEFIETGEADLADQFSIEVPAILIAELLDLPMDRRREFQKWAAEYVATFSPESQLHMTNAVAELYELRTAHPGDDIPSKLLAFEIDGRPISSEEWRGLVMLLILGGLDTTANAGGYIFNMIGQSEEIRAYLTAEKANIAKAV